MKHLSIFNFLVLIILLSLLSCSDKQKLENTNNETSNNESSNEIDSVDDSKYNPNTVNDELAVRIGAYLITDEEFTFTNSQKDRTFQLYEIDLNNDSRNEIFVIFLNTYFCGNSGCTVLLFNSDMTLNTKFSTMQIPIYVEKARDNNWATLKIYDYGKMRELKYNGQYPSNPSAAPAATSDKPSLGTVIIFGENNRDKRKFYHY